MSAVPLENLWRAVDGDFAAETDQPSYLRVSEFEAYSLDASLMQSLLISAPREFTEDLPTEIRLPRPDGQLERFHVFESPIMAPSLAAEFPGIRTFSGTSLEDPTANLRFDLTPAGFHAQVLSSYGSYYIDPYFHLDDSLYASYFASNTVTAPDRDFHEHEPIDHLELSSGNVESFSPSSAIDFATLTSNRSSGSELRTYRMAVAATGEYTSFHGGSVAAGQAAIVTAINRVTGLYESEVSIRFELVANNSLLVSTDGSNDPYTNGNATAMLQQNQNNIDNIIGDANYDIGHVFSTGGGGIAAVGVVGVSSFKAQGVTGLSSPIGDRFYIDFVSHEIGHQFSARHTFNGNSNSCSVSNRTGSTAYEPGSGSTIMGYAGICGDDDLQPTSDDYFHSVSLDKIIEYADDTIPSVGTRVATGNNIPTVNAGSNFTIPAATPFTLTAIANDTDPGDVLTYAWEQRDLGPQQDVNAGDNGASPLFRSWMPTTDPTRTFPRMSDLLNNTTVIGETLPTTNRTMNFRATVRDNRVGGGAVNDDAMVVNVVDTGAPFQVTSPNTAVNWIGGTTQTVTWNVAGTSGGGINATNVNILLSSDGGNTFPTTVLANTPNDGSQSITVPNVPSGTARLKVEGAGNIFFDVTNSNFTIVPGNPGVNVSETGGSTDLAEDGGVDTYDIALLSVPAGTVSITVTADADSEVSLDGLAFSGAGGDVTFNRTGTAPQTITVRAIDDNLNEGNHTSTISHAITSSADPTNYPTAFSIDPVVAAVTDNDVPGVVVVESAGSTDVVESGATDTYEILLLSVPVGPVEITVSTGSQTEVSLDGLSFAASRTFSRSDRTPQTLFVRAIDDTVSEGAHNEIITQAISTTGDPTNYPTSLPIANVTANIGDNDITSLVGVDLDVSFLFHPTNWTQITTYNGTLTQNNLIGGDGSATAIDLTLDVGNPAYFFIASVDSQTLPQHTQSLVEIAGHLHTSGGTIDATWADLTPGADYEIYVFGLENFIGMSDEQLVTITGAGTPVSFTQQLSNGNLQINDEMGSSSRELVSYAKIIPADSLGRIAIEITSTISTNRLSLGGLAIRPLPSGPQAAVWDGDAAVGNIGDGTTWGNVNNWTVGNSVDIGPADSDAGDDLVFQPAPTVATIDLGTDRIANSIRFQDSYALSGHTLHVTTGSIVVDANVTAIITSDLASTTGLIKTGQGTLVIGAGAPNVVVGEGTVVLASNSTVQDLTIGSGATAVLDGAVHGNLTNHGTIISTGDLNRDGSLTADDIDLLHDRMSSPGPLIDPSFDLVADGVIDRRDTTALLHDIMQREFGDTNLDGDVDDADFNVVAVAYDPLGENSGNGWRQGDFDGDGDVDIRDLSTLTVRYAPLGYGGFEKPTAAASAENDLFATAPDAISPDRASDATSRSAPSRSGSNRITLDDATSPTMHRRTAMRSSHAGVSAAAVDETFARGFSARRGRYSSPNEFHSKPD